MRRKTPRGSSAPDPRFHFDAAAAQRVVDFFAECLVHVKGERAGQPLVLEPWQAEEIVRPLFGWKRADGTRRYRTAYIEMPKKNGKSTLAAGLGLYLLCADEEPGGEVYSAAGDKDQAAIVFDLAKQMVQESAELRQRLEVYRRSMVYPKLAASYRVLSSDAYTKHGINAHGIIFDELHVQPNRELWDTLTTATGARRQPLTIAITTAGFDRRSVCWEQHDYALKVRDGKIDDPSFLPVIYAAEETDDFRDPRVWATANPGLGVTVKREYLAEQCQRAEEIPSYQNTFRRLHLNIWTESATRWLDPVAWEACAGSIAARDLRATCAGRRAWAGLDLSSTTDLSAFVIVVPDAEGGGITVVPRFWMPEEAVTKRQKRDRVPYDVWVRQGFLEVTPGNVVDYDVIRARVREDADHFDLAEIAYDRWNATQLVTQLQEEGATMVPIGQGFEGLSAPSKALEALVIGRQLRHGGHPVLAWQAAAVVTREDPAGNLKPDKGKTTERIDGIVALIMALARMMVRVEHRSVYEERGLLTV